MCASDSLKELKWVYSRVERAVGICQSWCPSMQSKPIYCPKCFINRDYLQHPGPKFPIRNLFKGVLLAPSKYICNIYIVTRTGDIHNQATHATDCAKEA